MKHFCIWLIRFYQKAISPLKRRPCCRFYPTCSTYAIQAFSKRGFFVGAILTAGRIFRCQPFCKGGFDPVPLRGLRHPKNSLGEKICYFIPENDRFVFLYDLPLYSDKGPKNTRED